MSESVAVVDVQGPVGGPVAGMPGGMDMRPGVMTTLSHILLYSLCHVICWSHVACFLHVTFYF